MDRRLFGERLKNPAVNLASPEEVLTKAPKASLVTGCKSAFDVSTKTAVPARAELRTQKSDEMGAQQGHAGGLSNQGYDSSA